MGRFATILGPLVWGLLVTVAGLPREVALAALIGFLAIGRVVLQPVTDEVRHWPGEDVVPPATAQSGGG